MQQLEAVEVPLAKIFSEDYVFSIPEYQRPYAWQQEQALQLLADLDDALERGAAEPYFLGSVVLVKQPGDPAAEVIDGQQRLTTLTVLLAVLRDLASPDLRPEIESYVVQPGKRALGLAAAPRLTLRQRERLFFRDRIQLACLDGLLTLGKTQLDTDAKVNLQRNAAALLSELQDRSDDDRLALLQLLLKQTYLVVVSTSNLASAHRIFNVMNARGLDLSAADVFKASVVGDLEGDERVEYAEKWEKAEESLGREAFGDLFLHVRVIFAKERARRELLREFSDQVLARYPGAQGRVFVDDVLLPYANALYDIEIMSNTGATGAEAVQRLLWWLHRVDNNDWKPPAMWLLRHHGHDPALLAALLKQLERLSAVLFLRRTYATPRARRFAELLRQLEGSRDPLEVSAWQLSAEERSEAVAHLDGDLYLNGRTRLFVLLRLDERLAQQPGVQYDLRRLTVEHVLPQSPAEDSQWVQDFSEIQREQWTHALSNLVLLNRRKNSEAQNLDFDDKKRRYFSGAAGVATFALTAQVSHIPRWTPEVLEVRQRQLLRELLAEWDLLEEGTETNAT